MSTDRISHFLNFLKAICEIVLLSVGVTWLITKGGGEAKSIVGIRGQVRMRGKVGLHLSLIHMHPFPHSHSTFFLFALLQLNSQKHLLGGKNIEGLFAPFPPPPCYVCVLKLCTVPSHFLLRMPY